MKDTEIRGLRPGVNLTGVRAHNERLILSLIQRHGEMPGAELAKLAELSPQTVSNILRRLEADGFLLRGTPQRGRVGKPSVPMALDPDGALSFGLKLGRRTSDLAVMNLHGTVLEERRIAYRYPMPEQIFGFLREGMTTLSAGLSERQRSALCGVGIAAPAEIWRWVDALGASDEMSVWQDVDFAEELAAFSGLPLFTENDATAACRAEHVFGRGREFGDYAYFFIGSFIGGGVVMNSSVVVGGRRNAGAFGSLPAIGADGRRTQLLDTASIHLLEAEIARAGGDTGALWTEPQDWSAFAPQLAPWIERTAVQLAEAACTVCAVIDFEAVLIDGAFPVAVREAIVTRAREAMEGMDMRGLIAPRIEAARVGGTARAIGAAALPIFSQFFLE
ncbi:ROK family transcriptional regulator [Albimonas sp. CAU 1670]|uniref:ROK family transcriptional regulator n=1 Tax=Albimonas sp. CAU 1670 TaxID=3032599 RepID=UPI0023DB0589|nr:ROK family transcriptional regulator [Albimonas sp. CAU 1670]MDF2235305.1 ROK family transcriptional regulator [Albimonas sp. CAU 1670]